MSKPINFYHVIHNEVDIWNGGKEWEAVQAYRQAPAGSRFVVTLWDSDEDEAHLIGQQVDITDLVGAIRGGWVW